MLFYEVIDYGIKMQIEQTTTLVYSFTNTTSRAHVGISTA